MTYPIHLFRSLLLLGLVSITSVAMGQKYKQAIRNIQDAEYDKVLETLSRAVEKDTLNPTAPYLYAVLFATDSFPQYDLDSANTLIKRGLWLMKDQEDIYLKDMERLDIFPEDLVELKLLIDSLAYVEALASPDIHLYERYLMRYRDSKYLDSVEKQLHVLAFGQASLKDTWQAYEIFLGKYPEADEAVQARAKFEQLVYEEKTKSGSLEDLEDFLIEYPATPYRRVVERGIFDYAIARLNTDDIYDFINTHNNPVLEKKGLSILYHLDRLDPSRLKSFNLRTYEAFRDSVDKIQEINDAFIIPMMKDSDIHFSNLNGETLIDGSFQAVANSHLCRFSRSPVLEVMSDNVSKIINRYGKVVVDSVSDFQWLGDGVVIAKKNARYGAFHVTGFEILPFEYESIAWFESKFFAVERDSKKQLLDFGGNPVTDLVFDDIYLEAHFWIFEQDGVFAVSNRAGIDEAPSIFKPDFTRGFEEVELVHGRYLIAFDDSYEVLFDETLNILTPPQTERINTKFDTWVFQMAEGYWVLDKDTGKSSELTYDEIQQNQEWLALRRLGQWEVHGKNFDDEPILAIDSVKLLGDDIAIIFRSTQGMAIFPNKELVYFEEGEDLTSLRQSPGSSSHFLVRKHGQTSTLYRDGIELFSAAYDQIGYVSDSAFFVRENGKYGLVDDQGRLLMRIRYDAIGVAKNGMASVLYRGKFGGFNLKDRVLLSIDCESKLEAYNDSLFIVRKEGLYGLTNDQNAVIAEAQYEKIEYWSDSSFLAQKDGKWQLINRYNGQNSLPASESFDYLKNTREEKIIWFQTSEGTGVYHSTLGIIIPPEFHDIYNLGTDAEPLYFAERSFHEAEYNIVVYYNGQGQKIKTGAYSDEVFDKILCPDF